MFRGILLDLDGTLADSLESLAVSCNKGLEYVGLQPQPEEAYKQFAGDGPPTLVKRALEAAGDYKAENLEAVLEIYQSELTNYDNFSVKGFEGMKEALDGIKENGGILMVITNKPQMRAEEVVEQLFGKNYFDLIIGFSDAFPRKPNSQSTKYAMEQYGLKPEECMYVGDTDVDMQTGTGAGAYTVGVLWGFREKEELEKHGADVIISHPSELLEIFMKGNE